MRIRAQCKACGMPHKARLERRQETLTCPNCADSLSLEHAGWSVDDATRVETCLLCGCRHLYRQRDFNRALGCTLVLIVAVYRDARPGDRQGEFDLLKHDVLKYGKSWQEIEDQ